MRLPQSVGPAGGTVAVPVQFTGDEGRETATLNLTVRFAAKSLTFNKVALGGLATSAAATATARARRVGDDTVLDIAITVADSAEAKSGLPDGPLAQLMFTLSKELKPESVIALRLEAAATGMAAGAKPVTLPAGDSEIIVSKPSVISCFFYMH